MEKNLKRLYIAELYITEYIYIYNTEDFIQMYIYELLYGTPEINTLNQIYFNKTVIYQRTCKYLQC